MDLVGRAAQRLEEADAVGAGRFEVGAPQRRPHLARVERRAGAPAHQVAQTVGQLRIGHQHHPVQAEICFVGQTKANKHGAVVKRKTRNGNAVGPCTSPVDLEVIPSDCLGA